MLGSTMNFALLNCHRHKVARTARSSHSGVNKRGQGRDFRKMDDEPSDSFRGLWRRIATVLRSKVEWPKQK